MTVLQAAISGAAATNGTPDFRLPVGNGRVPDPFSPLDTPHSYVGHEAARLVVGNGLLPTAQFRQQPGRAGPGTVSLEPILMPGHFLRRTTTGEVIVAVDDGSPAFAQESSFRPGMGLAGRKHLSFEAVGSPERFLRHVGSGIRVEAVRSNADRASATFVVT